ncbi:protein PFC0760c-like [Cydia splendana]|uniref:protein PFC0760c-like n=1 Tax=Cydia splendana TaxID=1100963 RepID=UPI00300C85A8
MKKYITILTMNVTEAIIKADSNITSNGNETVEDKSKEIVRESAELALKHDQLKPIILNATLCNNNENETTGECINNTILAAHNTSESTNELNDTKDKDAVMQYVSGKNDDVPVKTSGHIRNSLRRKKRSLNLILDNIRSNSAPEILHYETRHGPREREPLLPIHKLTQNKIQSANLADFNIETLHGPAVNLEVNKKGSWRDNNQLSQKHPPPRDESDDSREKGDNLEERKPYNGEGDDSSAERKPYISERDDNSGQRKPYFSERDDNSRERKPYISERDDNSGQRKPYISERDDNSGQRKPYISERDDNLGERKPYISDRDDNSGERKPYISEKDDNSGERKPYISERDDNSGEKKSDVNDASDESIETNNDEGRGRTHDSHTSLPENGNESLESEDLKLPSKDVDSKENQESNESSEDSNRNSKHVAAHARNIDSDEVNDNSDERDSPSQEKNSKISSNYDESNEENEKPKDEIKQLNFDASDKTVPKGIQDVDLGDFSYERIQVGKDGKVELAKDIYGKDDNDSEEEKPVNDKIIIKETDTPQSEYIEKVNNDEIKPVVELNTESNSNEYSDENVDTDIKHPQKADLNSEHSSEDLTDAKENDSVEESEKQIAQTNEQQNGNVKQQFERIPLNYKHDKKTENTENNKEENETPTDDSQNDKDGTLDTLLPKDESYDDKINFKFDDVSIKLPDIKLPDDILSYNYKSSPYKKKNKKKPKNKNRFYHYSDEHSDEFPKAISIPQFDDDRGYYKYDDPYEKKQDYKKKSAPDDDDDDEGVDLYEKFVRERFGKRGSFEKRSEALRNEVFRPSDPKLSETIQHILKKSAANLKEAEKSGDPKAGYMWTLEYGQNL